MTLLGLEPRFSDSKSDVLTNWTIASWFAKNSELNGVEYGNGKHVRVSISELNRVEYGNLRFAQFSETGSRTRVTALKEPYAKPLHHIGKSSGAIMIRRNV